MSYPIARIDPITPGRERSPALWRNELEKYADDTLLGTLRASDFKTPRTQAVDTANAGWYLAETGVAAATNEAFTTNADPDGVCVLSATTGTNFMGVQVQAGESTTQGENIVLPSHPTLAKGTVIFETRIYADVQANDNLFIGLHEVDAAVLSTTATLAADVDYIGFYRIDGGDLQFRVRNDNNGGTAVEYNVNVVAAADMPEDTNVKLGFRVNYDNQVEICVDGTIIKRDTAGANIRVPANALPIEVLTRTMAVSRGATNGNATVAVACDRIDVNVSE